MNQLFKIGTFAMFLFLINGPAAFGEEQDMVHYGDEHLYTFLQMTEHEYEALCKEGKSMAEIAEQRGVSEHQLMRYLFEKEVNTLRTALKNGKLTHIEYMSSMFKLKETLLQMIHVNPHKDENSTEVTN